MKRAARQLVLLAAFAIASACTATGFACDRGRARGFGLHGVRSHVQRHVASHLAPPRFAVSRPQTYRQPVYAPPASSVVQTVAATPVRPVSAAVRATAPTPTPAPAESQPTMQPISVPAGSTLTIPGDFGAETGQVMLAVSGIQIPAQVLGWDARGVTAKLPAVGVEGRTTATLVVTLPDGQVARQVEVALVAPAVVLAEEPELAVKSSPADGAAQPQIAAVEPSTQAAEADQPAAARAIPVDSLAYTSTSSPLAGTSVAVER